MNVRNAVLLSCLGLPAMIWTGGAAAQGSTPNIIHIFTDDLAWGSVGFNNASTYIQTPNLDALANGGMILNRSYASTVCSPSRANLMTGTHNGHALNDRNANIGAGLRAEDVTTGEVMQDAGYHTAIMGKWGWGASGTRTIGTGADPAPTLGGDQAGDLPNNQGFDRFYGYLNHGAAHDFYYDWVWETDALGNMILTANDGAPGGNPEYFQDLVNIQSEQYIKDRAAATQPFYLQLNYTAVHFDIDAVATAPALRNLDGEIIGPAGKGVYLNDPTLDDKQENYAATVTRMDASVGAIIDRLRDPDGNGVEDDSILDNTLIIFSSDNGATPEDGMGASRINTFEIQGGLRGGKRDLYEGGIRMPAFAYWNGTITPGTQTDLLNDLADVQATAADLAGALPRVGIDGVSILPTLTGEGEQRLREGLIFENDQNSQLGNPKTAWTVIVGDMKLIRRSDGTNELYNLATDMDESSPLSLAANAALVSELEALAIAEGVTQGDSYGTSYRDWVGADGDNLNNAASWQVTSAGGVGGSPNETWSALLAGAASGDATAHATGNIQTLGIEVAGLNGNTLTLLIEQGASVSGRNEVRINSGGRVVLQQAALTSVRWIDVLPGGTLAGQGALAGDLYNRGVVAPGQPADIAAPPPPEPPDNFTDTPSTLLFFNFAGVQDNNGGSTPVGTPLTQVFVLDPALTLDSGFQTGPGLELRHPEGGGTNAGNEWNVSGFGNGSLANAIADDDYMGFVVSPVPGLEMLLDEVSFSFWRNGTNAPSDYAILTSIDGFTSGDALATTSILHAGQGGPDQSSPATLTADYTGATWVSTLDVRIYGWTPGGGNTSGNTHFTAANLSGHFRLGGGTGPDPTLNLTGSLDLDASFTQYAGSEMQIDLGGTDNADPLNETFDQLNVTGPAAIAGDLALAVVEGFTPTQGDAVAVLTSAALTGQFETISGVGSAGPGLAWAVTYTATDVLVTAALPGDTDLDGDVDDSDLGTAFANYSGPGFAGRTWLIR
ncbi:MAG: sulfatase-like hydrolase/transferase, partial [Phycisphaeraceae bacterium]